MYLLQFDLCGKDRTIINYHSIFEQNFKLTAAKNEKEAIEKVRKGVNKFDFFYSHFEAKLIDKIDEYKIELIK